MPSGRLRTAGPAARVLGLLLLGPLLLGACTGGAATAPTSVGSHVVGTVGATAAQPPRVNSGGGAGAAGGGGSADGADSPAAAGDSMMTPIPEASGCSTVTTLGNRAPVRAEQLWPGASEIGSDAVEARARSGAGGCRGALPTPPDCDLSLPWAALDAEDLVRATGASRVIAGRTYARFASSAGSTDGTASLLYLALDFGANRALLTSAGEWFAGAVSTCGLGAPGTLGGVSGLVGERHKPTLGPGDAGRFLVATPGSQLVCLVFDGAAWSSTSRADVVRRVLPLLLAA